VREMQNFLGFTNYLRKFVPNLSHKCIDFFELTKSRSKKIEWNNKLIQKFIDLKNFFTSDLQISHYNQNKAIYLASEASDDAIGGIIFQSSVEKEKIIEQSFKNVKIDILSFFSCRLTSAKRNYSTIEMELLAVIVALKYFDFLFTSLNERIEMLTDHRNLLELNSFKICCEQHFAWLEVLQRHNINAAYIQGGNNKIANQLSQPGKKRIYITSINTIQKKR
jgi:RNase H-like domain found in reverse transcriptase